MVLFGLTLTVSDCIDLFGIIASLILSSVAIIISIMALRQNSKMIEDSTRPNIQIYPVFLCSILYIIIRNFGNSEAIIDDLKCNHEFSKEEYFTDPNGDDFAKLVGSSFGPGYSLRCPLASYAVADDLYEFKIKYHSSTHKYEGTFSFNPIKSTPFADSYPSANSAEQDLHNISKSLRDLVKLKL